MSVVPSDQAALAAALSHHSPTPPEGYELSADGTHYVFTKPIRQSPNDKDSQYRLVRLLNGMEAIIVHDPKAERAAASMDVRVGHLFDPDDLPGLAHFLEHLLFTGTAKYPSENEYSAYLSENGGYSNAYTDSSETVYYFDCTPGGFLGAVDRFAQFFIAPLFTESIVEREIKAVDSEHSKNLQNDGWRLMQLDRSLSRPDHPFHHFGTGSLETLWTAPRARGVNIRNELIKFYRQHYSANLMKLCTVSSEPLDKMTKIVVDTFSAVPNHNIPPRVFEANPHPTNLNRTLMSVKTVKESRMLSITYPFPDQAHLHDTRPADILAHFIGHEGQGSLHAYLKRQGWITGLHAGHGGGSTGFSFFNIGVGLTKEGLDCHVSVLRCIFAYINHLSKLPPSQFPPSYTFDEKQAVDLLEFNTQERYDVAELATFLSNVLQEPIPRSKILSPYLMDRSDPVAVRNTVKLLDRNTCRIRVATQEPLDDFKWDNKEKWYGTEYAIKDIPASFFESPTGNDSPERFYQLPNPNEFIPRDLSLVSRKLGPDDKPSKRPLCLRKTQTCVIWHKTDDRWLVPKASINISLRTPVIHSHPIHKTYTQFYIALVNEALNEHAYDANMCGLSFGLTSSHDSINLSVGGYSEKLLVLLKLVLATMKSPDVFQQRRFDILKDEYRKGFKNATYAQPLSLASSEISFLVSPTMRSEKEAKEDLEYTSLSDVRDFVSSLLKSMHIEVFGHGNIVQSTTFAATKMVEQSLGFTSASIRELKPVRSLVLPNGCNYVVQIESEDPANVNNGIEMYFQVGAFSNDYLRARLALLSRLFREPIFDQLRTKETLGYIVGSSNRSSRGIAGFKIVIQSEKAPAFLEGRINAFLDQFKDILAKMTDDTFEKQKQSLQVSLREDFKNMREESGSYWGDIRSERHDFYGSERLAELVGHISKHDMMAFYLDRIHYNSMSRSKISIHVYAQRLPKDRFNSLKQVMTEHHLLDDFASFSQKDGKSLWTSKPILKELLDKLDHFLVEQETAGKIHPCCKNEIIDLATKAGEFEKIPDGVTLVETEELKKELELGEIAVPVADWFDAKAKL